MVSFRASSLRTRARKGGELFTKSMNICCRCGRVQPARILFTPCASPLDTVWAAAITAGVSTGCEFLSVLDILALVMPWIPPWILIAGILDTGTPQHYCGPIALRIAIWEPNLVKATGHSDDAVSTTKASRRRRGEEIKVALKYQRLEQEQIYTLLIKHIARRR